MIKQFYFKQFSLAKVICLHLVWMSKYTVWMSNSSFWPVDRILSDATAPGQSGPGSDGSEGVLNILQSSSITGASVSDCLVSYPGHSLVEGSYPSAEIQSVYSVAPADWATWMYAFRYNNTCTYEHIYLSIYIYIYIYIDVVYMYSCLYMDLCL